MGVRWRNRCRGMVIRFSSLQYFVLACEVGEGFGYLWCLPTRTTQSRAKVWVTIILKLLMKKISSTSREQLPTVARAQRSIWVYEHLGSCRRDGRSRYRTSGSGTWMAILNDRTNPDHLHKWGDLACRTCLGGSHAWAFLQGCHRRRSKEVSACTR